MPLPQTPIANPEPDAIDPAPPPVAAEPPVVPAPPPETEPSPPLSFSLRDAAQKRGIDPSAYESDESLAEAMFSTLDTLHQNEPFVKIGQQFAPYADKLSAFQAWEAEQAKPTELPPKEKQPSFEWEAPEYDPRWEGMVERDERGFFKAPDGLPALGPVAEKMNRHREFQTSALTTFLSDPQKLIHAAGAEQLAEMEKRITDANQQAIQEAIAKQQADAEMNDYVQRQEKELFLYDTGGQPQFNADGTQMLSPKGHAMASYANTAQQYGITNPAAIRDFIDTSMERDQLNGRFGDSTTAPPATPLALPTPVMTPPKLKQRFLNRVRDNNRGGTIPDPTAPDSQQQNPDATFGEILREEAHKRGVNLS